MSIAARFQLQRPGFTLDLDFELPGSGVTGVLGPSGSGKTTLLRAMAGLERLPGGRLQVNGETWQDGAQCLPTHRRALGYVFQEPSLFSHLDVRGNLEFGLKRVPQADRRIALPEVVEWLGLGGLLDRHTDTLSGGERQRVAIARALAVSPRLLLLDEPLASLDQQRKDEIMPYLKTLHRELEIPMIHVSHNPAELAVLADHLLLLEAGSLRASGPLAEMLSRLDLPLAHLPDAAVVLEARVNDHLEQWDLSELVFAGGSLLLPRVAAQLGAALRLRIAARDVSLALEAPVASSILNCLPATVRQLAQDGPAQVLVQLEVGDSRLLSRITRKSAVELDLKVGTRVIAQVKSGALLS